MAEREAHQGAERGVEALAVTELLAGLVDLAGLQIRATLEEELLGDRLVGLRARCHGGEETQGENTCCRKTHR